MAKEYDIFQMYVNEMSEIKACDAEENAVLAQKAAEGDDAAKSRLIEGNLKYVLELSRDFVGSGVPASDLVQEANMALLMAVEEYDPAETGDADAVQNSVEISADAVQNSVEISADAARDSAEMPTDTARDSAEMLVDTARDSVEMPADTAGRFEKFLAERVKTALTAVVDEHKAQKKIGKKVLDRVNLLQDVSKQMAEELGREATVPELAQRLKMTEEEVKDTMKVALDALKALGED